MEVVGAVASALSLVDVMARSSSTIHRLISSWKDVPTEVIALGTEIDDSKAILNQVCHILRLLENAPSIQPSGLDPPPPALAIQQQVDRATPVWEELQGCLKHFSDRDSKTLRFRWLRCQRKIDRLRRVLGDSRRGIQELLASLSVYQSQIIAMQLVSLSSVIRAETSSWLQQILLETNKQAPPTSSGREAGAQELAVVLAGLQRLQPLAASSGQPLSFAENYSSAGEEGRLVSIRNMDVETQYCDVSANNQLSKRTEAERLNPSRADAFTTGTTPPHLTFQQTIPSCDAACQCVCHVHVWQARRGSSGFFKNIFGSILLGYFSVSTPKFSCDIPTCRHPVGGFTMTIRYTFPTWVAKRVLISSMSSYACGPRFITFRTTRRVPYVPGNIFSRINSRDFGGAIELLRNGIANVNDIETRHGISVLGAALRHPALRPGFVRFIEFLLRNQVDPHMPNDNGESPWHLATHLMLPNTPPVLASAELQGQLRRLFPNPDWSNLQFTHLHMVISGLRPVNLDKVLENPNHRSQINTKDALGQTPLGLAAMLGNDQAVETLLLAGADPNFCSKTATASDPLRRAVQSRSTRCVELLLMASTNPLALDGRGATLVHTAAAGCNNLRLIQPLLLAGIPIDSHNVHHCSPLSFTPLNDNHEVARFLLSRGANINNVDKDGDTPLTEAVRLNAHNCLRLFLDVHADARTTNNRGWTVLHFAAAYGDPTTMQILAAGHLSRQDPQALDSEGNLAMDLFRNRQYVPWGTAEAFNHLLQSVTGDGDAAGSGGSRGGLGQ
ncbi:ankyrin repeat-containing domain protein [Dactylonectria macrodidyma]|uniref:Ankyrin repeat-containing domain protein n=1 Tax=Dactylonectria macrodidyma TaxID=307937 RepID=A0A9P9IS46_9HYPO|nr:ankyrin repeat-containing domain protein [Dactylonectria macrodidyma]